MDKSCSLYSGILIYRSQRNIIEYLLLNDTYSNKKHWTVPKGQVIGNEDEIKCALRETLEITGLRPSDLKIKEAFTANLTYLSGTKPKTVHYHLAQLANSQARLPTAQGIHLQWCPLTVAMEKVIFKTIQQLLQAAQKYIEKQPRIIHNDITTSNSIPKSTNMNNNKMESNPLYKTRLCERYELEGTCSYGSRCNFAHGVSELRGKIDEAASHEDGAMQQEQQEVQEAVKEDVPVNDGGNQLFKTKLCERFMRDQFCQYGPKCHFAHGEAELKERPKKEEAEPSPNQRLRIEKKPSQNPIDRSDSWRSSSSPSTSTPHESRSSSSNWRSQLDSVNNHISQMSIQQQQQQQQQQQYQQRENNKFRGSESPIVGRSNQEDSWRTKTPELVAGRADASDLWRPRSSFSSSSSPIKSPEPTATVIHQQEQQPEKKQLNDNVITAVEDKDSNDINGKSGDDNEATNILNDLRRPAFTDHQRRSNNKPTNTTTTTTTNTTTTDVSPSTASNSTIDSSASPSQKTNKSASSNNVTETDKSWMKIVKLTKEEQDELQIGNQASKANKANQSNGGITNQEECIIKELKKFFTTQKPATTNKGKIADDVKEVTKMEMRNDLSKSQLLFILFASLLEDSEQANANSSGTLSILKSRNHIFKMHVKTAADQLLLLKAWEKFVKTRKPSMVNKTAAALSHWYDVELVEEEVFVNWYNALEKDSPIEKKSAKFIEWLSTAEEEEEDED